jgi:aspartyl-tRNA(Asn)/glutamyl-tRNA(Gln) amidotransferase subunit A
VAFGLAPAAIGSDTGGSVRIPAAWNDLVGLKTTAGSLPLTGTVPLCERFDTIGPLAHSVEDCAQLLPRCMARPGRSWPVQPAGPACNSGNRGAGRLRDRPAQGFDDAAGLPALVPGSKAIKAPEVAEAMGLAAILFTAEAYGIWRDTIEKAPEKMFPADSGTLPVRRAVRATDYVAAWRRLLAIRAIWADRAAFDAVIMPTSPILPPDANRLMTDDAYYVTENLLALRNTRIGNMMGLCALTLPTSQPSCGISLMAAAGEERRVLRLGAAAERALR